MYYLFAICTCFKIPQNPWEVQKSASLSLSDFWPSLIVLWYRKLHAITITLQEKNVCQTLLMGRICYLHRYLIAMSVFFIFTYIEQNTLIKFCIFGYVFRYTTFQSERKTVTDIKHVR